MPGTVVYNTVCSNLCLKSVLVLWNSAQNIRSVWLFVRTLFVYLSSCFLVTSPVTLPLRVRSWFLYLTRQGNWWRWSTLIVRTRYLLACFSLLSLHSLISSRLLECTLSPRFSRIPYSLTQSSLSLYIYIYIFSLSLSSLSHTHTRVPLMKWTRLI